MGDSSGTSDYDVFLSHSGGDAPAVEVIAGRLRAEAGLRPFLDRWHLTPGARWQDELSAALEKSGSVAVFVGPSVAGPWRHEEMRRALDRAVSSDDDFRVIPVLLPGADPSSVDGFLAQRTWVDFSAGLDDGPALRRLVAGVRGEAFSDDRFQLPDQPSPYRGLWRFEEADAPFFFGRAPDVERLSGLLGGESFVAVVGPSGSGKSSLVRAGLAPRLARSATDRWHVQLGAPGDRPFRNLARQVGRLGGGPVAPSLVDELAERFRTRPDGLATAIGDLRPPGVDRVLLVVDQFEELFTLGHPDRWRSDAAAYVRNLAVAASAGAGVGIVVTLRADFVATALEIGGTADLLQGRQLLLGPLTGDRLREAIVRPAEQVGAMFEKGLVARLMHDVGDEPGALPLLQHALFELWTRRRGPWLTVDAYEESGGVVGALTAHADGVCARMTPSQQRTAKAIFIRLTTLGDGVPDTRRRVLREELYPTGSTKNDVDDTLAALSAGDARLVVVDGETVEVAHEALLRNWTRLRGWLDEDRDALRVHRRLTDAARVWNDLDRDPSALYSGARLAEAGEYDERHGDLLTAAEREFLDASHARVSGELERERRRARTLRRRLVAATTAFAVAVVGVGAALFFLVRSNEATDEARAAAWRADAQAAESLALALAGTSESLHDSDPALALAVAAEAAAATPAPRPEALAAVVDARSAFAERTAQPLPDVLTGHRGGVLTVEFSPDGALLASGGDDGRVRLWDPATAALVGRPLAGHEGPVAAVAFSPDGSRLVSVGEDDGRIVRWSPETGETVGEVLQAEGGLLDVAYSPDGSLLAAAGDDGRVWVADLRRGSPVGSQIAHDAEVRGVAFSPDGRLLASASDDGSLLVSAVRTGETVQVLSGAGEPGWWDVAFSPDGRQLATGGTDGSVQRWDPVTGQAVGGRMEGHRGAVAGVAYAPGGDVLVSTASDGTIQMWSPESGQAIGEPVAGHSSWAHDASFSPSGTLLASAGGDEVVRLWDLRTPRPLALTMEAEAGPTRGVALHPTDPVVVSAHDDGTVRRWDRSSGEQLGPPIRAHDGGVHAVTFDPQGAMIVSGGVDGTVRRWEAATGAPIGAPMEGHSALVVAVEFSPDGRQLVTSSEDGTIRRWDPATGDAVGTPLRGHDDVEGFEGIVFGVAISGTTLASAADDGSVRLWDLSEDPVRDRVLGRYPGWATDVTFSPDGTLLVSTDSTGGVHVWDLASDTVDELDGHVNFVWAADFTPDGALLATAGDDRSVRLWDVATRTPVGDPLFGHDETVFELDVDSAGFTTASADGSVVRWDAVWDSGRACDLAAPYLAPESVASFLPVHAVPAGCPAG